MQITYRSEAQTGTVVIAGVLFERGQTKDVAQVTADEILTNPNFVDEHGKNPNFECGDCGKTTYEIAMPHPRPIANGPTSITMRHEDGKLRCRECFLDGGAHAAEAIAAGQQDAGPLSGAVLVAPTFAEPSVAVIERDSETAH